MLAVHCGTAVRGLVSKEHWDQVWMAINWRIAMEVILPTWDVKSRIDWSTWATIGLLGPDEEDSSQSPMNNGEFGPPCGC